MKTKRNLNKIGRKRSSVAKYASESPITRLTLLSTGEVQLSHGQSVKQSLNYNTLDASFHISVTLPNDAAKIEEAQQHIVEAVEEMLAPKVEEQRDTLSKMSK